MEWLGHDVTMDGAGHGIVEYGKIPGVGGEGKVLGGAQDGKQQQPGQQEIAEKKVLPIKSKNPGFDGFGMLFNFQPPGIERGSSLKEEMNIQAAV
jgi:hypothetical protein